MNSRNVRIGVVSASIASLVAGLSVSVINDSGLDTGEIGLLILLAIAVLAPFLVNIVRNVFDVFEPIYVISLATFEAFVWSPAIMISGGAVGLRGIDYRPELVPSLALALLALLSFYLGYYSYRGQSKLLVWSVYTDRERSLRCAWIVLGIVISLIVLQFVVGRIPLQAMFAIGVEADYGTWWREADLRIGYLFAALQSVTPAVLLIMAFRKSRTAKGRNPIILPMIAGIFLVMWGNRTRVATHILATVIFWFLNRNSRPRLWQMLGLLLVVLYVAGALGYYRVPGHGVEQGFVTPQQLADVLKGDRVRGGVALGMMTYIRIVPSRANYLFGESFLNVFTQAVPRVLWPDKPVNPMGLLIEKYATTTLALGRLTTAPPFFAEFYVNFGVPGVIVGMLLLGVLCRAIYFLSQRNPNSQIPQILLAVTLPFLVRLYNRGPLSFIVPHIMYLYGPILIVAFLGRQMLSKAERIGIASSVR